MLPRLDVIDGVPPVILDYLTALEQAGFSGDISSGYADRLLMATDNSVYQLVPQAVLFPCTSGDIVLLCKVAADARFHEVHFVPRGGGTGTTGGALGSGVVVDLSRHMNRVLEINIEEGWARVEAGVIKDQLNACL
ncbi:MAG: FAD-binding oxidoreductase, partial [Enterobacteriaceae bacterium]